MESYAATRFVLAEEGWSCYAALPYHQTSVGTYRGVALFYLFGRFSRYGVVLDGAAGCFCGLERLGDRPIDSKGGGAEARRSMGTYVVGLGVEELKGLSLGSWSRYRDDSAGP